MSVKKFFATKDSFISNFKVDNIAVTGSNVGKSPILSLFKISSSLGGIEKSRLLVQFDVNDISSSIVNGSIPSNGTSKYYMKLFNVIHDDSIPSNYSLDVFPISQSWDEGDGYDLELFSHKDTVNWEKAKDNVFWSSSGGSYVSTLSSSYYVENNVLDDIELDITDITNNWISGTLNNFGLLIKFNDEVEADSNDYFVKKFISKDSIFDKNKTPCIEVRWDDSVKDDRNLFYFDNTSSLHLYHKIRGNLENIQNIQNSSSVLTVHINDQSGNLILSTSASWLSTGIYKTTFAIQSGTLNNGSISTGSIFGDTWFLNDKSYMSGTFYPKKQIYNTTDESPNFEINLKNLRDSYDKLENIRFDVSIFDRKNVFNVVNTASIEYD